MYNENFILQIPADEYHAETKAGKFLSSHMLGDFRNCPELYRKKLAGEYVEPESQAFLIGRAAHSLILEGRTAFDSEFVVSDGPINPKTGECFGKTTKAYAEWLAAQNRTVISGKDFAFISKLQQSVWLHPEASELLANGVAEGVIRADYEGEPCQIRMDFYSSRFGIIDLKTCDDLRWFENDFKRYGYGYQLAFYRAVLRQCCGENRPCYVIAVEKREPFRCGVWRITEEALDLAEMENKAAIARLHKCRYTNTWPTGFEELRFITNI